MLHVNTFWHETAKPGNGGDKTTKGVDMLNLVLGI